MKILIVGSNNQSAIERYYVKHLVSLGATVQLYPAHDIVYNKLSRNLVTRALFKTKLRTWYGSVNKDLLVVSGEFKPDIIWIFKGMEVYPKTLLELKRKGFKLANFNPDHPFIISSSGSGNKNVTDSVPLYDLHFCYHNGLRKEIQRRFKIPTVFLPFAFEHGDVIYTDQCEIMEINKICLQANPDNYRVAKVEFLTKEGLDVDVYGIGWNRTTLVKNPRVKIFGISSRGEFWKKNQEYRLQLNLFREYNFGSHNMRTFEIPAVGGIQLTPYSDEQAAFFEEGKEIFFFHDDRDMIRQAKKILNLEQSVILKIREAARNRSLVSGYSFADRALLVHNTFTELIRNC